MGRPAIQLDAAEIERLAAQGLRMEEIAASLGIGVTTLYAKKAKYAEFREAVNRGRAAGVTEVTNALMTLVREGNPTAIVFYLKARGGWRDDGRIDEGPDQSKDRPVELHFHGVPETPETPSE